MVLVDDNAAIYAHTLPAPAPREQWEPLIDHLHFVAEGNGGSLVGAGGFATVFGAGDLGRLLGWWHDLGKYSQEFQRYLIVSAGLGDAHQAEVTGRVDHSTAGAQHAAKLGQAGRLLAYCIAGHHAGLPDNEAGERGLSMRLKKCVEPVDTAPAELLTMSLPALPQLRGAPDGRRKAFAVAFLTRMLFSCLVDADFLATEWFVDRARSEKRPMRLPSPAELIERLNGHLDEKQRQSPATPVNLRRQEVLAACRHKAELPPGFFFAKRADRRGQDAIVSGIRLDACRGARHVPRGVRNPLHEHH
jgi:CRISPR-associated endonuclease/helicase Cas3